MVVFEYKRVCLNRWIGRCPGCEEDYDLNHHPNNFDCVYHKFITVIIFNVEKNGGLDMELSKKKEIKQPRLEELARV